MPDKNVPYPMPLFMKVFFAIIIAGVIGMFFASCKSPYEIIAQKANPSDRERSLLSIACAREFPMITSTFTIDSTIRATQRNYSKQIDSLVDLTEILDSIIHEQIPILDTTFVDSSNCLPRIKIAHEQIFRLNNQRNVLQASINSLKNQIQYLQRSYQPCDSVKIRATTTTQCDSAMMRVLHDRTKTAENALVISNTKLEDKKKAAKNWMWAAIGLGALLVVGITLSVKKMFTKKVM